MEYKEEKTKQIDVVAIAKTMWQNKKAYIIVLPVVAILSYLIIVCVPRTYTSTVKLAPELSSFNSSSLSDIASSFGFDMGTSKGGRSVYPVSHGGRDNIASSGRLSGSRRHPVHGYDRFGW